MSRPRTELRIVNIAEDGSEEVIEGINLNMTPDNHRLVAEWGVEYPDREESVEGNGYPRRVLYQGEAYFRLSLFAPMIPDEASGHTMIIHRKAAENA